MLALKEVTKSFGSFQAVSKINLEFTNGVYGMLAPNGAGKTTIIKMITTLLFPSQGEILYNGEDIYKMGERFRSLIGYLPQQFGYYKNQSPKEYLLYLAALKGMEHKRAIAKTEELLELVSLAEVKNKKMKKFSGGMLQRVGIAQAMLNDPKILILDEPTAGLDPKERVRFRNIISTFSKDRIVILSTHIVSDIESIANRIIMLKDKQLLCNDTMQEICKTVEGKVYETYVEEADVERFRNQYYILSNRQEQDKIQIRFLMEGPNIEQFTSVHPNLEDVFLYIYKEE